MPANLTPQYLAAEQRFKDAATMQDKIEALEEMMAVIPKHKETEQLQAELRRTLARLRTEGEKKHGVSKASAIYSVPREESVQSSICIEARQNRSGRSACCAQGICSFAEVCQGLDFREIKKLRGIFRTDSGAASSACGR